MRIINKSRIFEIMRRHFFIVSFSYIAFIVFAIFSQEKLAQFSEFMPPELVGLEIISISLLAFLVCFVAFSISVGIHIYKVLSCEYLRVWDSFVEGPTEKGERVVMSFSQIKYMGRDLLGRYSLDSGDQKLILPGKLSISTERFISKMISSARLKDNL